jgi:phosphatidylinositol phospholipase C delta
MSQLHDISLQGYGRALWLMHGFYKANGACGYVKKPDFLMQTEPEVFDPKKPQPVKKTLKVCLYFIEFCLCHPELRDR